MWKPGQPHGTPTASGLTVPFYDPPSDLEYGTTYCWQVAAQNVMGSTTGPEWCFTTQGLPEYRISLVQGFNLFAYPAAVPAESDTCQKLLANLGTSTEVQRIMHFNPAVQHFESCDWQGGQDFSINSGEGYLVWMTTAKTVTVRGKPTCPALTLTPGINLIGHAQPPADFRCFDFLNDLGTGKVTAIQRFNTITGAFETCIFADNGNGPQPAGVDFPIAQGVGYIVHRLTGGTVVLPGCGNQ